MELFCDVCFGLDTTVNGRMGLSALVQLLAESSPLFLLVWGEGHADEEVHWGSQLSLWVQCMFSSPLDILCIVCTCETT